MLSPIVGTMRSGGSACSPVYVSFTFSRVVVFPALSNPMMRNLRHKHKDATTAQADRSCEDRARRMATRLPGTPRAAPVLCLPQQQL